MARRRDVVCAGWAEYAESASRDNRLVRIAFSGSHRHHLLEQDGYESEWPPSAEDYVAQLDRSVVELQGAGQAVLFDRCPADLLAYLLVQGEDIAPELERSCLI